jgi:outer membrane murein-binding lipoprotein Lpp
MPTEYVILGATLITGVVGWLVVKVIYMYEKKLDSVQTSVNNLNKRLDDVHDEVHSLLDAERTARLAQHNDSVVRLHTRIDELHQASNDLSVTVAGIGGLYATRSEVDRVRETMEDMRRER